MYGAFMGWLESVTEQRRLGAIARRIAVRLIHRGKIAAFNAWRGFVSREMQRQGKMATIMFRMRHRAVSNCFAAWRGGIAERRRWKIVARRVADIFSRHELRKALNKWIEVVEQGRENTAAQEEQQRASRNLRLAQKNRRDREELEREKKEFLRNAEESERQRVRVFHQQLARQQKIAADKAEAAMNNIMEKAEAMAASLAAEAKAVRDQKPGMTVEGEGVGGVGGVGVGGGGGLRQKRALRAIQNRDAADRKQAAVRLEVTARIENLKSSFATACEAAEKKLRDGGPGSAVAALSEAERIAALHAGGGSISSLKKPEVISADGGEQQWGMRKKSGSGGTSVKQRTGSSGGSSSGGSGGGGGRSGGRGGGGGKSKDATPRSSDRSPSSPPSSSGRRRALPTKLDAKLAAAESVVTKVAVRVSSATAVTATAAAKSANASAKARMRGWEERVKTAERAATKAARMAREASSAARDSKRDFLSLRLRREQDEAAAMLAIERGELIGEDGRMHYLYNVGDEGPTSLRISSPADASTRPPPLSPLFLIRFRTISATGACRRHRTSPPPPLTLPRTRAQGDSTFSMMRRRRDTGKRLPGGGAGTMTTTIQQTNRRRCTMTR